ncbi:MAG: hypothetical protein JNJ71_17195 [Rubrivivax sp.]|nr:hypothetical protein [Rubrivivax sp.]
MTKPMFDQTALIEMFENATSQGSAQLREAVSAATLQALQGREMTMSNLKGALKTVAEAASMGAAKNVNPGVDPQALLDKAVTGMDDALLKAVEAHRTALAQLAAQGADLREKHLKKALSDLDKMEDALFSVLKKTADGVGAPVAGAWGQVLEKMQAGGTQSGTTASAATEQLLTQMQSGMRESRAASIRAAQALAEGYSAMVSGVLLGMSEALKQGAASAPAAATKTTRRK